MNKYLNLKILYLDFYFLVEKWREYLYAIFTQYCANTVVIGNSKKE